MAQVCEWVAGMLSSQWGVGIATGVVSALLYTLLAFYWSTRKRRKLCRNLKGTYKTQKKISNKDPDIVEITVKGRVVHYVCNHCSTGGKWEGEVVLSDAYPYSGVGNYRHDKPEGPRWGIHHFQFNGNGGPIFVHTIYSSPKDVMVMQGFVWEKLSEEEKGKLLAEGLQQVTRQASAGIGQTPPPAVS